MLIDGVDYSQKDADKKKLRRTVGVVFQYPEYQLFEETIAKDIAYGPRMTGIPEEELENRTQVAMEAWWGWTMKLIKTNPPLSFLAGRNGRLPAGVLAMEPKILIMDEPIAGLDPLGRESLMDLVKNLNDCGMTILMISHNMDGWRNTPPGFS